MRWMTKQKYNKISGLLTGLRVVQGDRQHRLEHGFLLAADGRIARKIRTAESSIKNIKNQ